MFRVTGRQIQSLQGGGGEPFTAFVDALLRAHGSVYGLVDSDIETSIQTTTRDGGVDTSVRRGVPGDPTGWLSTGATCWQYKARRRGNVERDSLLQGTAVRACIEDGYAFRLAIADSFEHPTRRDWESRLTQAARAIRADTPEARIVSADDIAEWASRYPGLVLKYFLPGLGHSILHLEAWKKNALDATRQFVDVPDWQSARETLTRHVSLSAPAVQAVVSLQGEAGVGKTRLVYEVVAALQGAEALVVYSSDEDAAIRVATALANDESTRAVLVADECGLEAKLRLEDILRGHRNRVRVVGIDNTGQRTLGQGPELVLGKMPPALLGRVLDDNYPNVLPERRRAYARAADGFPRLAADLCAYDPQIAQVGGFGPVVPRVDEYLRRRLTPEQQEALAACALFTKVGYASEVREELDALCVMLDLSRSAVERALDTIHEGPGFVAKAGRYYYVTPELVAKVSFAEAWRRWARQPVEFFQRVPDRMVQPFLDRALQSASEEVRRTCAAHFRDWVEGVRPEQLQDIDVVRRLTALVNTEPSQYLPRLRRLIEQASLEALAGVSGNGLGGGWGPRRKLVWLAEGLVRFPDYFDDAERTLLRLALAEAEPGIGNNSTAIWRALFRVYLSGTSVPFSDRLARLRQHLHSADAMVRSLAASALHEIFDHHGIKILGPPVVAGRIAPEDWRPRTFEEERDCYSAALDLVLESFVLSEDLRTTGAKTAIRWTRWLVARGFLKKLRDILSSIQLTDDELAHLVEALDEALAYDLPLEEERDEGPTPARALVREEVVAWRQLLATRDLHARVVSTVGKDRWAGSRIHAEVQARDNGAAGDEYSFSRELNDLADLLMEDPRALIRELPWLVGDSARSAGELGEALGLRDADGSLLSVFRDLVNSSPAPAVARGFVHGLSGANPQHAAAVNAWLDDLEKRVPAAAAELAMSAGASVSAIERVTRLFDAQRVSAAYLSDRNFIYGLGRELSDDEVTPLLERLATASEQGDEVAERVGLDMLFLRLPNRSERDSGTVISPELVSLAWRLLGARPLGKAPAGRWWSSLVIALGRTDATRAARLAAALLLSDDLSVEEPAREVLTALAKSQPDAVMDALGAAMLDPGKGWRFFVGKYDDLIKALPVPVIQSWVEGTGVEGVRRLARHLPPPYLDNEGRPVVPQLTEWVLEKFEADDRAFEEFCAGVHSLQMYFGDIASQHEVEASTARRFRDHRLRRVREWADIEVRAATVEAERARIREAESDLP